MTKPVTDTTHVAHRIIRVLSKHPDIARDIQPFDHIKDPKTYRKTLKDTFDACCDLDQFAAMVLTEDVQITLNPAMPDNIYIEVSGDPDEKDFIFAALEALEAKLTQAIGKSGKRLITIDIPEVDPAQQQRHTTDYAHPRSLGLDSAF